MDTTAPSKKEVCKKLDSLLIQQLKLVQEIIDEKENLEELMKGGFINMAKARYCMGPNTVGKLQLPTEDSADIEALYSVSITDNNSVSKYTLIESKEPASPENVKTKPDNVLRQRKKITSDEKGEVQDGKNSDNENSYDDEEKIDTDVRKKVNPLNWFGVLVPSTLRESQRSFRESLQIVCNVAGLQTQLVSANESYNKLLEKKMEMLKISEEE